MIQAVSESSFDAYLSTEDTRIDTSVSSDKIRYLMKFTNDMDKSVQYAYSTIHLVYDRYTKMSFTYNTTPMSIMEPLSYYQQDITLMKRMK